MEPFLLGRQLEWLEVLNVGHDVPAKQTSHPRTDVWHTTICSSLWSIFHNLFWVSQLHTLNWFCLLFGRLLTPFCCFQCYVLSICYTPSFLTSVCNSVYSHMALLTALRHTTRHAVCCFGMTDAVLRVWLTFPPVIQLFILPNHSAATRELKPSKAPNASRADIQFMWTRRSQP